MATMTLAQAARQMEESGTQIKVGHFDTFADFMLYFEQHYKPMLEQRNEGVNYHVVFSYVVVDVNTDASRGRYLLNSIGAYPHMNKRKVKNGFQYDTTSANGGPCTTTVTLERGWAA